MRLSAFLFGLLSLGAGGFALTQLGLIAETRPYSLWLNSMYGCWIAIAYALIQLGVGAALMRLPSLRELRLSGLSLALFRYIAGAFACYCLLLALALCKSLHGMGVALFLALTVPVGGYELWRMLPAIGRRMREPIPDAGAPLSPRNGARRLPPTLVAVAIVIWLLPLMIQSLLPNSDWDSASFHLPVARSLMAGEIWRSDPASPVTYYPAGPHLSYALFMALGAETAIVPYNLLTAIGIVLAAFAMCAYFWGRRCAWWAAAIVASNNVLWEVGVNARICTFLALHCVAACYAMFLWLEQKRHGGLLALSGMALGLALSDKYTAVFFVPVLALPLLWGLTFSLDRKVRAGALATALLLAALPSSFWYARNAIGLGDPLYPMLRGNAYRDDDGKIKPLGPDLERLIAMHPESSALQRLTRSLSLTAGVEEPPANLLNLFDVLTHPGRYARKPYHWASPFILLFFLLPLFRRDWWSLWLYVVGVSAFVSIAVNASLLRYALPALPFLSAGAALILARRYSRRETYAVAALIGATLLYNTGAEWVKLSRMAPAGYLSGRLDQIAWLEQVGYNSNPSMPAAVRFINENVELGAIKPDDNLFMVGEGKGDLLKCGYIPDFSQDGAPWLAELVENNGDYRQIVEEFERAGVTHILVNSDFFRWALRSTAVGRQELAFSQYHLRQFLSQCATRVFERNGVVLAKLTPEALDRPEPDGPSALPALRDKDSTLRDATGPRGQRKKSARPQPA